MRHRNPTRYEKIKALAERGATEHERATASRILSTMVSPSQEARAVWDKVQEKKAKEKEDIRSVLYSLRPGDKVTIVFAPLSSSSPNEKRTVTVDEIADLGGKRYAYTVSGRVRPGNPSGGAIMDYGGGDYYFQPTMRQALRVIYSLRKEGVLSNPKKRRKMRHRRNPSTVADTIAKQLGGISKLQAMVGAKNMSYSADSFQFKFSGSQVANYVEIKLLPSDTYKITFYKIRGLNAPIVKEVSGVDASQLRELFEQTTKLYLSLGTMRGNPRRRLRRNPEFSWVKDEGSQKYRIPGYVVFRPDWRGWSALYYANGASETLATRTTLASAKKAAERHAKTKKNPHRNPSAAARYQTLSDKAVLSHLRSAYSIAKSAESALALAEKKAPKKVESAYRHYCRCKDDLNALVGIARSRGVTVRVNPRRNPGLATYRLPIYNRDARHNYVMVMPNKRAWATFHAPSLKEATRIAKAMRAETSHKIKLMRLP